MQEGRVRIPLELHGERLEGSQDDVGVTEDAEILWSPLAMVLEHFHTTFQVTVRVSINEPRKYEA